VFLYHEMLPTVDVGEMGIRKIHTLAVQVADYAGAATPPRPPPPEFSHLFPSSIHFPSLS